MLKYNDGFSCHWSWLNPCEINGDIYCIHLKYYFCDQFSGLFFKISPICGELRQVVSGGVSCGIEMKFGGSLLGEYILNLFGENIGFGYIMIMATEQYPEV